MIHPIRNVHVFLPPTAPVALRPPKATHRWRLEARAISKRLRGELGSKRLRARVGAVRQGVVA